jgi:hypothetical protein
MLKGEYEQQNGVEMRPIFQAKRLQRLVRSVFVFNLAGSKQLLFVEKTKIVQSKK